jgi:hypothetical protein
MITAIRNIVAGEGYLEFEVVADYTGADEIVSTELDGERFGTHVEAESHGASVHYIKVPQSGTYTFRLEAERSGTDSGFYTMYVKQPKPATSWCEKHKKPKKVCRCS